jgi:ABC-type dipeptide/oligopeptide/nickel transport system permease subunit
VDPRIEEIETPPSSAGPGADYEVALVSLNQWQLAWRRFKKHHLALFGAGLFMAMVLLAVFGPILLPYDPQYVPSFASKFCEGSTTQIAYSGCPPFTPGHLLGTTGSLRLDLLTLIVSGARISLTIGIGASLFSTIIGTIVGGVAGYFGGWIDNILMRFVDVMLSVPILFVIIWCAKVIGNGDWRVLLIVFAVLGWPGIARLVRSLFLTLRTEVFVDAARAVGVSDMRIIFRHILPNAVSPIIVATTLSVAGVIISEAFVSFLGYGVNPAVTPTWGNILTGGLAFVGQGNWWWTLFPGLAIVITVLGINFMGDGLRDALDPRSRE